MAIDSENAPLRRPRLQPNSSSRGTWKMPKENRVTTWNPSVAKESQTMSQP